MSLLMMLAGCGGGTIKTQSFTANATWIAPLTVTSLATVSGKGAAGTPASSGTQQASVQGDSITGNPTGTGSSSGTPLTWPDFQSDITTILNTVNQGGNGIGYAVFYDGYPNSNSYTASPHQYSFLNAIAGTASVYKSPGWKSSGVITQSDYGYFVIFYQQSYSTLATTGASATAFGKTFTGGAGGSASTTNYTNVTVTPGAQYSIVVPSGGVVTISYYG